MRMYERVLDEDIDWANKKLEGSVEFAQEQIDEKDRQCGVARG